MKKHGIPLDKKHLFWSADVSKLDSTLHKQYIIHQTLQYGSLNDFKWLNSLYSQTEVENVFTSHPRKTYSPRTFNFVKKYLLHLDKDLDSTQYVSNL